MPVIEYKGELWGFLTDDGEVLCFDCYEKASNNGRAVKVSRAIGTADTEHEGGKNRVYICDGHGCAASNL